MMSTEGSTAWLGSVHPYHHTERLPRVRKVIAAPSLDYYECLPVTVRQASLPG